MLTLRHLRLLTQRTFQEFADDNCTQMAAAISYYVLFSLFPLVIFSIGVLGLVLQDSDVQRDLISQLTSLLPVDAEGEGNVETAVQEISGPSSGALGLIGLVGMAWSASAMFGVIRRSLNIAFDLSGRRPLVRQKLVDFGMMALLGAIFVTSIGATTILRLARTASDDIPVLGDVATEFGFAWAVASFVLPIFVSTAAFGVLYWIVPATHVQLRDVWPGAILAAVLFELVKLGFGIYLENFSNYDVVFGSLGAVVAFLFLVFVSANVLLLGAEVAAEYPRVIRGDYDYASEPGEQRSLRQKALRAARGLVVHERPHEEEASAERPAEPAQDDVGSADHRIF